MRRGNLSSELHRALGFLLLLVLLLLLSPPMRQEGAGVRARMGSMSARPPADGLGGWTAYVLPARSLTKWPKTRKPVKNAFDGNSWDVSRSTR